VIEGEYGTTVAETGPEEPGLSTVLPKHAQGDMDPVRELPYRLAALNTAAPEAGQMAASDKRQTSPEITCAAGGVHRWKADVGDQHQPPRKSTFYRITAVDEPPLALVRGTPHSFRLLRENLESEKTHDG
jgi:hypothetical protein